MDKNTSACETARLAMSRGPVEARFRPEELAFLEAHIAGCEECRDYQGLDPLLRASYRRLREEEAPERVRGWIFGATAVDGDAGEVTGSRPGRLQATTLAGFGLAALFAGALVLLDGTPDGMGETVFMEDYLRRASPAESIETSSEARVRSFFRERLGVELVPITAPGVVIQGAEICILDGELGALIRYTVDGRVMSHYVVPREGRRPSQTEATEGFQVTNGFVPGWGMAGEQGVTGGQADAVNLVTWSSWGVDEALVGDFPVDRLLSYSGQSD